MAKGIVVDLDGEQVAFDLERVDREKLYGKKLLQVVDASGQSCTTAWLTRDGGTVIPPGGLAFVYVRPEDLSTVERSELTSVDESGQPAPSLPSTLGVAQPAKGPIPPSRLLDFTIASVYALSPDAVGAKLLERLRAGEIFEVPFAYRGGAQELQSAFLLANDQGFFALVGAEAALGFIDKDAPPPEPVGEAEDDGEELDFSMM